MFSTSLARLAAAAMVASALTGATARADIIDFDSEGFTGPSLAYQTSASSINVGSSIGTVKFEGGAILTNETALPADQTSLFYNSLFLPGSTSDVITINFTQNINNFFVNIYNGQTYPESFTVFDNLGNSATEILSSNTSSGASLVSFAAAGDTVMIRENDPSGYDFSIDNIGFDQPTPTVPEPASMTLLAVAFIALGTIVTRSRWT